MHNEIKIFISEYLKKTFEYMGIETEFKIENSEDFYQINLETNNSAILIGKNGKTLNALQRLIKLTIQNKYNENIKIRVEISNYRKNQEDQLKRKIKKIAKDVIKTKMDIKLDPMNSYQRRIVHEVIKEYSELKSESIGESPNRYIVISIKD